MNITILDIAIIAVPLVIVMAAFFSRFREKISRQTDEINEMRKAVLKKHIQEIQARAQRTLVPLNSSRDLQRRDPAEILIQAR
jgi:uncharacterized membrane protein YhiD involved in acid resistance